MEKSLAVPIVRLSAPSRKITLMNEKETVAVELSMLNSDAEHLEQANEDQPIVAEFEHHAEPIKIAFGEVESVKRDYDHK